MMAPTRRGNRRCRNYHQLHGCGLFHSGLEPSAFMGFRNTFVRVGKCARFDTARTHALAFGQGLKAAASLPFHRPSVARSPSCFLFFSFFCFFFFSLFFLFILVVFFFFLFVFALLFSFFFVSFLCFFVYYFFLVSVSPHRGGHPLLTLLGQVTVRRSTSPGGEHFHKSRVAKTPALPRSSARMTKLIGSGHPIRAGIGLTGIVELPSVRRFR